MARYVSCLRTFLNAEDGPSAVEYAIMLALIVVVCLSSIYTLGDKTDDVFDVLRDELAR